VQTSKGMAFGKLMIFASGNKAEIDQIAPKGMGVALGDVVREHLRDGDGRTGGALKATESPLDKLRKLGELRDAGVLSEDEFNQQKARLLDEI
jgi:hypothetical protein